MPSNFLKDYPRLISSDQGIYYEVLEILGKGGNSEVYLVMANSGPLQGLLFALKMFVKIDDATRLFRFRREIEFLSNNPNPSLLRVFDTGTVRLTIEERTDDFPFAIFEYLPQTLHDALRTGLTMVEKAAFTLQLLSGLRFLSAQNPQIVHRDIKLKNIFVRGKSCILGDFGLMKVLGDEQEVTNDKEFYLESVGPRMPRGCRSPDLVKYCKDEEVLTVKSDVFQLGLVLAEMFTGRSPLIPSEDRLSQVRLYPLTPFVSAQEVQITGLLRNMLMLESEERPPIEDFTDGWIGVFRAVSEMSQNLEGKVFP